MDVGNKIRMLRTNKGLTQKELATKSHVSENAINQYERGKRQPKVEYLKKIADALEVNINTLILTEKEATNIANSETINEHCKWISSFLKEDSDDANIFQMQRDLELSLELLKRISLYHDKEKSSNIYTEIKSFIKFKYKEGE